MDHAHLLQRPGRNLRRVNGRSRPTPPSPSPTRQTHRPALPPPRQHHHSHLHRGLPLLRRKSLARLPQHPPPHLSFCLFLVGAQHAVPDLGHISTSHRHPNRPRQLKHCSLYATVDGV